MIVFINLKIFKLCITFFNMTVSTLKRHVNLLEVSIFLSKLPNVWFQVEDYKMNLLKESAQKVQPG